MSFSEDMRTERDGKDPLTRTFQRRRTLSNITNLSLSASWASDARTGLRAKTPSKTLSFNESQLREENTALKRLLSEKDLTIESQAGQLDQMQKEFFVQLRRQTKVNEELIAYNSRLSKDGGQLRDQLKLLQHEFCQMTVVYRVNLSELQVKLTEAQDLNARFLEQINKSSTDQSIPGKIQRKLRSSSARRRHSVGNIVVEEDWNDSTNVENRSQKDGVKRSDLSRRRQSLSKETTTGGSSQVQQRADDHLAAAPTRTPNLYCDLIGLGPMPEGSCEDDNDSSPRASTSEEASSNASDDFCTSGKSGSAMTSDSVSRRAKPVCIESTSATGKRASALLGNTKASASGSSSVASSVSAPHFSRRVAINSSLSSENGRPLRRAVVKVASYTEPALNTKMRRPS